jgi:hypothetical protein
MEAIALLEHEYFLLRFGVGSTAYCVDWAVDRLRYDEEGDDLEVVLLASARGLEEVLPLVEVIVERHCGESRLDDQLAAGKYIVALRAAYLLGQETTDSLEAKFHSLYFKLGYPDWLTMLCRNCEYATDVDVFEAPFESEFAYISRLWEIATTRQEFEEKYSRAISSQHDAKLG